MTQPSPLPCDDEFASPETLLSAIVDSTDDAIVSKNLEGIITSWNQGAERIFGFTAEEMVGRSIMTIIPTDRQNEEVQILSRIRSGERVDHFDTRRQHKNGTLVNVSLTISPIRNTSGRIVGASKIARDITKRKEAEAALAREQRKLQALNEVGMAFAAELDLEKLIQTVTDVGRELSGAAYGAFFYTVTKDDGEALTLYTLSGAPREAFGRYGTPRNTPLFGPTFAGAGVVRIADVLQDPRYGQMEPHHGMPEGHLPVRSYLALPVISRSGNVNGGLFFGHPEPGVFGEESEALLVAIAAQAAVAIDNAHLYDALQKELVRQKKMEASLRESEAFSSSVLNSSADCIEVLDLGGDLLSINPSGLALLEIDDFSPYRRRSWASLWPEPMQNTVREAVASAASGSVRRFQGLCPTVKGTPKWWDVIVTPVRDALGGVARLTATSRDVTDQRKAAEEVRAAVIEAERQSRMKDEFLATLSHELRTPLQSILGWIQLLRADDVLPEDLTQGLEVIDRNAQSQTRIIEDLLDMSRILSGKVRLDVQRVDLAGVIEAALETVKPAAEARGIRLQAIVDPLAKPIAGDSNRLQQIFWNLLSNGIKFTPTGGRVQILLERVNSHLEVSVTDTGAGISPEFLPFVFERFRQADASTTRRHGGLGLGLAIVKHLVELHGGSVRAKSAGHAQGSTFTIVLPLAAVAVDSAEVNRHPQVPEMAVAAPRPRLENVNVLVVDDESDARNVVAKLLEKAGATVETAKSADEALRVLQQRVPDVLVSDIGMPSADGYSLIRSIRALPLQQGGNVPAIALTAYTRTEDRIKAISLGFQMHIAKPADGVELLTMVESLARKAKPDDA